MPRLRLRRRAAARPDTETLPETQADPGTGHPPSVLVMTMVRDEAQMLPRWIDHYAGQVGMDNLLVLDDNSSDGSTVGLSCTVHRLPSLSGKGFESARMQLLSGLATGFLATYDYVVFVDADEFLVPDPALHRDLPSFLATRRGREVVAPMTLNVVHVPSVEEPLRAGEPVLGQRRFAKFAPVMCKPSIKRVPASWRWASHGIAAPFAVDPELYMFHLKFADRDLLRQVAAHRKALTDTDGRARGSSWSRGADDIVAALDRAVAGVDVDTVPEFDPGEVDLAKVVEPRDGWHRAVGAGQVQALRQMPLRRVPSSLLGSV